MSDFIVFSGKTANVRPDTLWYTRGPVPTPLGIAAQHGWLDQAFSQFGTAAHSLSESDDPAVRNSFYDHSVPNSIRQSGSIAALWARARGSTTRLIGLTWTDEFQAIITLPENGIRNVADLRGRRLGLPARPGRSIDILRAAALRGYLNALSTEGLGNADVELIDLQVTAPERDATVAPNPARSPADPHPYTTESRALLRGEVDAIFVKGAQGAEVLNWLGAQRVIDIGRHPDPAVRCNNGTPRTLTVDIALLEQYPELVTGVLRQVQRAAQWAENNPVLTRQFIARETHSSEFWVGEAYGENVHRHMHTTLDPVYVDALQGFGDFLVAQGFIEQRVDVRQWIDASPLESLQRESAHRLAYSR
jgi:ABC-type nitrate/sulfonate/bicarbonate transport system substrate-binding protein